MERKMALSWRENYIDKRGSFRYLDLFYVILPTIEMGGEED